MQPGYPPGLPASHKPGQMQSENQTGVYTCRQAICLMMDKGSTSRTVNKESRTLRVPYRVRKPVPMNSIINEEEQTLRKRDDCERQHDTVRGRKQ